MSVLTVEDLRTHYFTEKGIVRAVDGVSFNVERNGSIGIAGESGSGKTTLAYSLIKLLPYPGKIVGGHIYSDGEDLVTLNEDEIRRRIRWKRISMVFQSSMSALNPIIKVGDQIVDVLMLHKRVKKEEAMTKVKEYFRLVGLDPDRVNNYPFELSGGMQQRAVIALSLISNADLVIADEPTTALDVTIQAQIIDLIKNLQKKSKMSLILITHDLSVIAETCEKCAIMYAGKIVEYGSTEIILNNPIHPYTKALLKGVPRLKSAQVKLRTIPGEPVDFLKLPSGCRFHPRCIFKRKICTEEEPRMIKIMGRDVACHFADELKDVEWK
jgi:peptide/nickel transport system ATP-binding protein